MIFMIQLLVPTFWLVGSVVWAQAQDPSVAKTSFDVASVKQLENSSNVVRMLRIAPGMLSAKVTLKRLVAEAYSTPEILIVGGKTWDDSVLFDVSARSGKPANQDQVRLMLRTLLADRFSLRVHVETRHSSYSAIVEAKHCISPPRLDPSDERPFGTHDGSVRFRDLSALAQRMSAISGQIVIDQTGLEGIDITIPIERPSYESFAGDPHGAAMAMKDAYYASLARGAQRMGLRVESKRGPLEFLVIDSAERPTQN